MKSIAYRYRSVLLLLILAFAFFTRMNRLHIPERYMFDEVYHALTAKLISRNDPRAYEWWNEPVEENTAVDWLHPPLAKYTQALSILAFGENSFGWRFSSVVFGVLVIMITYHLAYRLFDNHLVALVSAFLASLDGLLLVMSRIAMNDIHVTFFILLSFYFYATYRKERRLKTLFMAGLSAGCAVASKWSGIFAVVCLLSFEFLEFILQIVKVSQEKKSAIKKDIFQRIFDLRIPFILLFCLPILIYLLGYSHMFLQGKDLHHFKELHKQTWWYQTNLDATHPYQSRPIEWFLDLKPVWVNVQYLSETKQRADIYAFGNPALFWIGCAAVFMTVIKILSQTLLKITQKNSIKTKTKKLIFFLTQATTNPLFFLIFSYFIVWLPWQFSPRIMFFYHYAPAVPLLCILISYWFVKIWNDNKNDLIIKSIITGLFFSIIICFVVWYPHWAGIPVADAFADTVYFAIPSWK